MLGEPRDKFNERMCQLRHQVFKDGVIVALLRLPMTRRVIASRLRSAETDATRQEINAAIEDLLREGKIRQESTGQFVIANPERGTNLVPTKRHRSSSESLR